MAKLSKIFSDLHDGCSIRQIHRDRNVSRQLVRKYKSIYEEAVASHENKDEAYLDLLNTKKFSYKKCERTKKVLVKFTTDRIDELLAENDVLRNTSGQRKLVKNNKTIFKILQSERHTVSYSSVCSYIANQKSRKEKPKDNEAFIRIRHAAGDEVEFDWGCFSLEINGALIPIQMAVFTFCHSNYRVAYIYLNQNTLSFNDAHVRFFRKVGGVPNTMIYDNMRIVVKSFNGRHKELTDCLLNLEAFYHFKSRLCNVRAGNEKGQVERAVDVVRQQVFAHKYKFDSFEEACTYLEEGLAVMNQTSLSPSTENIVELAQEDFAAIRAQRPYSSDMPCFELEQYVVDKYSTISFM